jgi:hypothetical protein
MVAVVIPQKPGGESIATDTPTSEGKRRWGKACNDCRKSKVCSVVED